MLRKVFIANRGEIAVRVIRACHELGIKAVAAYSEADAEAAHVLGADESVCIGPPAAAQSYLHIPGIIAAARTAGADAIHPGYGFLSENAEFARAVEQAGLVFVGPSPETIALMGDKTRARHIAAQEGVPVVPADESPPQDATLLAAAARRLGYPLMIKAAAGGGGKGMRVVGDEAAVVEAFRAAGREALSAFGDGRLFLERCLSGVRHVEVQILADAAGAVRHLGERDCSVQRRHQKIIEETPSPAVSPELRQQLTAAAIAVARAAGYRNAGTVEFLLDQDERFYFLEMNTRLQVEHPVTEWVTGIDLVAAQLRVAAGEPLWWRQEDLRFRGHALECRICAEDPAQGFRPSPGTIVYLREPSGAGIRVDSGVRAGYRVPPEYDSLLAKVSVWAETREGARQRMRSALRDEVVLGCTTNVPFLLDVLEHPAFVRGDTHTEFLREHFPAWQGREHHRTIAVIAAALDALRKPSTVAAPFSPWGTLGSWRVGEG